MRWVITLVFLCFGAMSAQAAEPWPANVCKELAVEQLENTMWGAVPWLRGVARDALLSMQHAHCGIDIRVKYTADSAAIAAEAENPRPQGPRPKNCVIIKLEGGLSTVNCP
jgi:hypothetical protein